MMMPAPMAVVPTLRSDRSTPMRVMTAAGYEVETKGFPA